MHWPFRLTVTVSRMTLGLQDTSNLCEHSEQRLKPFESRCFRRNQHEVCRLSSGTTCERQCVLNKLVNSRRHKFCSLRICRAKPPQRTVPCLVCCLQKQESSTHEFELMYRCIFVCMSRASPAFFGTPRDALGCSNLRASGSVQNIRPLLYLQLQWPLLCATSCVPAPHA